MDESKRAHLEDWRQVEHLLPVLFAFLLPYISLAMALLLCTVAVLHALVVSPRLVRVTTRPNERAFGWSPGKLYYALSVAALLIAFRERLYLAAVVWAMLAVGDSLSNLVGRHLGGPRLAFNTGKTWAGLVTFWISGSLAGLLLYAWNSLNPLIWPEALLVCVGTAVACGLVEALPTVLDDNILICWVGGAVAWLLSLLAQFPAQLAMPLAAALLLNLSIGLLILGLGWISIRGAAGALAVGVLVSLGFGWQGFACLLGFLVPASIATQLGRAEKSALGLAEPEHGRRGLGNVLSKGVIPALLAVFAIWIKEPFLQVAFVSSLAAALFDTTATEMGQWLGRTTVDPWNLRRVSKGTPGAMSAEGTLAGFISAVGLGVAAGLTGWLPWSWVPLVAVAGSLAGLAESLLGSVPLPSGPRSGHMLNFFVSLLGASLGGVVGCHVV